jgi:hypothetical protein
MLISRSGVTRSYLHSQCPYLLLRLFSDPKQILYKICANQPRFAEQSFGELRDVLTSTLLSCTPSAKKVLDCHCRRCSFCYIPVAATLCVCINVILQKVSRDLMSQIRLRCLSLLLPRVPRADYPKFVLSLVPDVIMCTKEVNVKARQVQTTGSGSACLSVHVLVLTPPRRLPSTCW